MYMQKITHDVKGCKDDPCPQGYFIFREVTLNTNLEKENSWFKLEDIITE